MDQADFEHARHTLVKYLEDCINHEMDCLTAELATQRALTNLKTQLLSLAYDTGMISGKNAEMRAVQAEGVLLDHEGYQSLIVEAERASTTRKAATLHREAAEREIGLIRAWLYSQGGHDD